MRHLLLIGEYELTIDEKNRLLIPAEIRKQMNPERDGIAFYMVIGLNRKLWLYPERSYEEMVFQVRPEITPGEEHLAFSHVNFGLASRIEWDSQGRLLIPEKSLRRAELTRELAVIGSGDHLELWNRGDWAVRREELLSRIGEIAILAKQARMPKTDAGPKGQTN